MNTKALRQKILDLAIHGKLVTQDPNDEPASVLLERIRAEKERLIKEGKIKKPKKTKAACDKPHYPFELPKGWVWCKLIDSCHIAGRIGFRGYTKEDLVEDGAITLSPSNIVDGNMDFGKCTYISWDKYNESPEIMVQCGDILLVKTGSSYGKCAFVKELPKEATINPQFVVLKYIQIDAKYLTCVLQSSYARQCYDDFVLGTAIPTFTQAVLGNMYIPLPSIAEQKRIVDSIKDWTTLVEQLEFGKSKLQDTIQQAKSKILDLAIHGKLVPQDPNDEPAAELLKRINPKAEIACDNPHYQNLPIGWCVVSMQLLCSLVDGEKQNGIERINLDVKYLRGEREAKTLMSGKYVAENTLLILVDGENSGEVFRTPTDGYQGSTFKQLAIDENMNMDYVLQVINLHRKALRENKVGSAIPHLNKKMFKAIDVPIPPCNEQQRIVNAINKAFTTLDRIMESL